MPAERKRKKFDLAGSFGDYQYQVGQSQPGSKAKADVMGGSQVPQQPSNVDMSQPQGQPSMHPTPSKTGSLRRGNTKQLIEE